MKRRNLTFPALLALMLAGAVPPVFAQTGNEDDAEGPGRGVARLSLMNGEVSVRRGDSGDWVAGAINAPLMTEDRVFAGPRSRAEVQFDYYHRIRLAEVTEVRLADIENGRYLLQLARGTATFSALKGGDAQVEISTPAAAVRPVAYGSYRITVREDGTAEITVRSGEVEIYTPSGTQRLRSGRTMLVRNGENGEPVFQMVAALGRDDWDRFNENRDKELRRGLETYRYVSRDIYGAEDLYGNGDWVYVAPYGYVWQPYVAIGWAPYRYGRWAWTDWYGWTWVSYDPWGWAPYHYGRWFHHGGRWCWYPGAYVGVRHYWSPGIVAWFGWGGGGVGIGFGGGWGRMGWVPLAPYDPFHRWWGRSHYRGYRSGDIYNRITVVNNVNITNIYRNARVSNAISVHDGDFSRGMKGQAYRGDANDLGRASLVKGVLPVSPGRDSMRYAERDARAVPQSRNGNERFYARTAARGVERVPFDRQREVIQTAGNRALPEARRGGDGIESGRSGASREGVLGTNARGAGTETGRTARTGEENRGGWRTVGEAPATRGRGGENAAVEGRSAAPRSGEETGGSGRSGWRSFGNPSGTRTAGDIGVVRTGRAPEADRGGEAAATEPRSGWRSFGDPGRGTRNDAGSRSAEAPARSAEGNRGIWSTRTGENGGGRQPDSTNNGRSESGRSVWSTRGNEGGERRSTSGDSGGGIMSTRGNSGRDSQPSRIESPRSESPRMEMERSTPSRNESPSRGESPRTGGRGGNNDMAGGRSTAPATGFVSGASEGRWSTSGGSGEAASSRSFGTGSTGGVQNRDESRSAWSGTRGGWSTGGGETGSRPSVSRSESFGTRSYGMSESRSMPSTRSMDSRSYGSGSSRSYGGGGIVSSPSGSSRNGGGSFGGGMSSRSSGGFGGGGGIVGTGRSSGGGGSFGGGGARSSGGGGSRGGRR